MNITPWVLAFQGVNLLLQLAVMYFAVQCDKRHDKCATYGTKERERAKWWEGIEVGTLVLFMVGLVFWVIGLVYYAIEATPEFSRENELKCETIDGKFSRRLDACYKEGVKINFNEGEMTYGE